MVTPFIRRLISLALLLVALPISASADWEESTAATPTPSGYEEPSSTVTESYSPPLTSTTPPMSCSVYANGTGMGSYCVSLTGGGAVKSLKERFGGLEFDRCRFREVPAPLASSIPPNPHPDQQRAMLKICLEGIDWNTATGGPNRSVSFDVVWVLNGTDVTDVENRLNTFLWEDYDDGAQLPVPHLTAEPIPVPLVNTPAWFDFTWMDPGSRRDVGPVRRVELDNGVVMVARAATVTVDPNVKGMDPVTCPAREPRRCELRFEHSSADAEEYSSIKLPRSAKGAYWVTVSVQWQIKYGHGTADQVLGDGFTMVLHQELEVQESQGMNQPAPVEIG